MNKRSLRLVLAAVVSFYVVFGGLWATNYIPLQKLYSYTRSEEVYVAKFGYEKWYDSKEYKEYQDYAQLYALTHSDIFVTESKIGLYQSILLWVTVALGVGGFVLFLTRGKREV